MKINIPVGCIVLVREKFTLRKALTDNEYLFNYLLSKVHRTEYTSAGLTDINDEGDFCIVEVTSNGIKKKTYEEWRNLDKSIEIFNINVGHSKEKLYLVMDVLQERTPSKNEKRKFYYQYLLLAISKRINSDYESDLEVPSLGTWQLPGYVWNEAKSTFPFWRDHTGKSLKNLLSLNSELLFKGNSKEL